MCKYVTYKRVSTEKQGRSGLGLGAQQDLIDYFVKAEEGSEVVGEYVEVYTGTDLKACSELRKAIDHAKREGAKLIMAKSDRFRNLHDALEILDELGEGNLICCDIPNSTRFMFQLFWAIAEREALLISIRTKGAEARIKKNLEEKGMHVSRAGNIITRLGNPKWRDCIEDFQSAGVEGRKERYRNDPKRIRAYKIAMGLRERGCKRKEIISSLNAMEDDCLPDGQKSWNYDNYANMMRIMSE